MKRRSFLKMLGAAVLGAERILHTPIESLAPDPWLEEEWDEEDPEFFSVRPEDGPVADYYDRALLEKLEPTCFLTEGVTPVGTTITFKRK